MNKNKDTRKKALLSKKEPLPQHLAHVNGWAAGIDIGATSHFVAVPEGCDEITVGVLGVNLRNFRVFCNTLTTKLSAINPEPVGLRLYQDRWSELS